MRERCASVLGFPFSTLLVFFATIALTVTLYIKTPRDISRSTTAALSIGSTRASADISFQYMLGLQQRHRRYRDGRSGGGGHRVGLGGGATPIAAPCTSA